MLRKSGNNKRRSTRLLRDKRGQAQYLTVMLLFALGLGMVVAVNYLFDGLTDSVQDNVARKRLENYTYTVRDKIIQTIAIGQQGAQNSEVRTEIHLPAKIGTIYDFEITLSPLSTETGIWWVISSRVINAGTVIDFSLLFRVDESRVSLGGSFLSTADQHFIIFRSGSYTELLVAQCLLVDI
ncbi:MAG: hypothetical protein ACFFB3_09025 [Candidatus Hodarchaeota archaeon]